jgi:RNA polymerase sigma factor (sigma-70 family)
MSDAASNERYQALVLAQGPALRRLAATYEADRGRQEDLWQEICLALWRALPAFRGDCSERTFAFRIAHNRGISHALRHRGPHQVELDELDEGQGVQLADPAADPERQVAERQTRERLLAAVRALPLVPRQVLTLSLEGLSHKEIGEVLGLTDTNVAVRLHRARERVRATLAAPAPLSFSRQNGARP